MPTETPRPKAIYLPLALKDYDLRPVTQALAMAQFSAGGLAASARGPACRNGP